jgi:hypothetical protein
MNHTLKPRPTTPLAQLSQRSKGLRQGIFTWKTNMTTPMVDSGIYVMPDPGGGKKMHTKEE